MSVGSQIEVTVNDRAHPVAGGTTLQALLAALGFGERKGIAAAVNGAVIPKAGWAGRELQPADKIIVIQATQGG